MFAGQINVLLTTAGKFGLLAFQDVDFLLAVIKKLPRKQFLLNSSVQKRTVTDGVLLLISVHLVGTGNTKNANNLTYCTVLYCPSSAS